MKTDTIYTVQFDRYHPTQNYEDHGWFKIASGPWPADETYADLDEAKARVFETDAPHHHQIVYDNGRRFVRFTAPEESR